MTQAMAGYDEVEVDEQGRRVVVRPMITTSKAVDLYLGDLTRGGYSIRTIDTYSRLLLLLVDEIDDSQDVSKITTDDCRRFLNHWNDRKPGTRAHVFAVISAFFKWLYQTERIKRNPLEKLTRPKRVPSENLDVITVSTEDVKKLIAAASTHTEKLAILVAAYMGARRRAIALLKITDYDQKNQTMKFLEKGGKVIWKPVPAPLAVAIKAAIVAGSEGGGIRPAPDDYLVPPPPRADGSVALSKSGGRDDRVIWNAIKAVAKRADVKAHTHALRAAFAVYYLETHPGNLESLRQLMGHSSLATTQIYLRKLNREQAMESVRDLDWDAA